MILRLFRWVDDGERAVVVADAEFPRPVVRVELRQPSRLLALDFAVPEAVQAHVSGAGAGRG